jgi:hypothetical protein
MRDPNTKKMLKFSSAMKYGYTLAKTSTEPINCDKSSFGGYDPNPNTSDKACYCAYTKNDLVTEEIFA